MELSIALEKPCYYPGDVLKCLVKVRATAVAMFPNIYLDFSR
jgi:sporulation-control protein spo0M